MKKKIRNIKYKLTAIWWLITRKTYYLMAFSRKGGKTLEYYNVVLPEFISWLQKTHGMMARKDLILELRRAATSLNASEDMVARSIIKDLMEKLRSEEKGN